MTRKIKVTRSLDFQVHRGSTEEEGRAVSRKDQLAEIDDDKALDID